MFRKLGRSVFAFATTPPSSPFTRFFASPRLRPLIKTLGYGSIPAYLYYHFAFLPQVDQERNEARAVLAGPIVDPKLVENPKTFWEKFRSVIAHTVRLLHLILIFLPPIITLPLRLFKRTEQAWLSLFVRAVERAGVVWIKAFQYLSHRRDVIGPEMAEAFSHLRENAPQHSFEETKRNFKLSYGKEIGEIFSEFDPQPIASGSVSQVYKAVYQGKKVAVKVRHP
jgi:aarF domain-containing kinase